MYRYSIIAGGAYSPGELAAALDTDHPAAQHFQGFRRDRMRIVQSPFTGPVYVSYRKRDSIFWTSHPIRLHQGETLLTDGTLYARARCGNRISEARQEPVAEAEPDPEILNLAETPDEPADGAGETAAAGAATAGAAAAGTVAAGTATAGAAAAGSAAAGTAAGGSPATGTGAGRDPNAPGAPGGVGIGTPTEIVAPEPGSFLLLFAGLAVLGAIWFGRNLWRR